MFIRAKKIPNCFIILFLINLWFKNNFKWKIGYYRIKTSKFYKYFDGVDAILKSITNSFI